MVHSIIYYTHDTSAGTRMDFSRDDLIIKLMPILLVFLVLKCMSSAFSVAVEVS